MIDVMQQLMGAEWIVLQCSQKWDVARVHFQVEAYRRSDRQIYTTRRAFTNYQLKRQALELDTVCKMLSEMFPN